MGGIPVRTFYSIKRDGIGGMGNDRVILWILRNGLQVDDTILGKILTFLAEDDQSALQGSLHHCLLPYRYR